MTKELVLTVCSLADSGRCAARDGTCWSIAELISCIKTEMGPFVSRANAEEMPIQIRHERIIVGVGNGVLIENIASADRPSMAQITGGAEFIIPASLPME